MENLINDDLEKGLSDESDDVESDNNSNDETESDNRTNDESNE